MQVDINFSLKAINVIEVNVLHVIARLINNDIDKHIKTKEMYISLGFIFYFLLARLF